MSSLDFINPRGNNLKRGPKRCEGEGKAWVKGGADDKMILADKNWPKGIP